MLRHMMRFTRLALRLYGRRSSSSFPGSSVPRARAPMVSMIRFTQSIITAFRGGSLKPATAPISVRVSATVFTVSWNCRNLRMLSKTLRPQRMAFTMELKLSSSRMMSEAARATSVPQMPMLSPTSASFSAGASLVPSPVTPTTSPVPLAVRCAADHSARYPGRSRSRSVAQLRPGCRCSHSSWSLGRPLPLSRETRSSLSSGVARATTCSRGSTASSCAGVSARNSCPLRARPPPSPGV
mmetsp:Transcript_24507/g.42796  ORF Transcript_24507/g.42796 Transcript_24507/m.42796 type:complete len:240 (-) Transcript_24507:760-1479(-)